MRWELLKTIVWLRWKLSQNQLRKAGKFLRVFLTILTVLAIIATIGVAVAGFLVGRFPLAHAPIAVVMYVVDGLVMGFLFFWMIGILAEIQRSESIDLNKLLRLPVTLKDAFVVNFIATHLSLVVLLTVPFVAGLTVGLALGRDTRLVVLLPLYLGFLFLISSWTYYLRGWLVQLMVNPRRRRTIIISLTAGMILIAQLPNIFFNVIHRTTMRGQPKNGAQMEEKLTAMKGVADKLHYFLPPLWVGWGTRKAADNVWWPAAGSVLFCIAGGAIGLSRAYQSTLRFYRGAGKVAVLRTTAKTESARSTKRPLEGRLPFLADDISGAGLAFLRSMVRAPELKMALLGPVLMVGVLVMVFLGRDVGSGLRKAAPLVAIGMTVFSFTGILQIAFNQFGWDRTGFRALILLPTSRRSILLAKNVATSCLMLSLGMIIYVPVALFLHLPLTDLLSGLLQVISAVIMLCAVGNYFSIILPVRMNAGSLKPTKMPVTTTLAMMLLTLMLPIYMIPVYIGPALALLAALTRSNWSHLVNLACSVGVLVCVSVLYGLSLKPLGRLFWEREQRILQTVTVEIE